jgi:tetratricopeptide (TPR) repeat protein
VEAEQLYQRVIDIDKRHFGAVHGLGLVRLQQGRFADAVNLFRRAIKIDRNSAEAHHHLAVALTGLGRAEEAIERYERALAIRPDFAEAHDSLGHALQLLGRYQAAIVHHEMAIAAKPSYAEARNNLGNALYMLDQSEKAILQYEKALAIRPDYAEAHNNLGRVLSGLNRHEQAIARYRDALTIRPDFVDARINLGNALGALGRYEEATEQYDNVLAISPKDVKALVKRGYMLSALRKDRQAVTEYDKALAIRRDDTEALTGRGISLIRLGQEASAAEIFNSMIKRGVRSVEVLLAITSLPASMVSTDLLALSTEVVRLEGRDKAGFENIFGFVQAAGLDRASRHEEAWEHLVAANRTRFLAAQEEFDKAVARERASLARMREQPARAAGDSLDGHPISLFILGPSRSGKTTMEKLVSVLGSVERGYEDPIVENAVRRASRTIGLPTSTMFEDLPATGYSLCREMYLEELTRHAGAAKVFTNTNPGRIHEADLIPGVFPNVRFLFMKRNVDDNVLRIYQRAYKTGNFYAYDLKAARDYVVWYNEVMDLLTENFPKIIRVIHYEDMVDDPAAALRTAAELCSLPMTSARLPPVGDDRGCAAPYLRFLAAELAGTAP